MSSEDNIGGSKKQKQLPYCPGMVPRSSHPSGQQSPSPPNDTKEEDTRLSQGPSGTSQSYTSSPRVNISQLSSDMTSSRGSTMRQVEEEVRKLATAEEQSRRVVLQPHRNPSSWGLHSHNRSMQRTEPWKEEDPAQPGFSNQSTHSNSPELCLSDRRKSPSAIESSTARTIAGGGTSSALQFAHALPISEESASDLPAAESQISRQGDGRNSKNKNMVGKASLATVTSDRNFSLKSAAAAGVVASELSTVPPNDILSKDFGQMFPSSECIAQGSERKAESVGVQTGNSLLYLGKSSRKRDSRISVSTSERESTTESLGNKQSTENNEGTDYTKKQLRKSCHGRTSDKIKLISNRKHNAEKTYKPSEISKEKEILKGTKRNKESKYKSYGHSSNTNRNATARSSRKEISKDKFPKEHQVVTKLGKEERVQLGNRAAPSKGKARSKLDNEERTQSSHTSSSQSVESICLESTDHGGTSSGMFESLKNGGSYCHSNDEDSFSGEYSKEADPQPDNISEDFNTNQRHHSPPGKQNNTKERYSSLEPVHGLKGGAEESLIPDPTGWLLISPPMPKNKTKQKNTFSVNNDAKCKSTKTLTTTLKSAEMQRERNLKNKTNLVQHSMQREAEHHINRQGSGSARLGQHTKPGTLKVGLAENQNIVSENKQPVRFEVTFSKQENIYPKSKLPATTTTTTAYTHSTKMAMTLQVK